MKNNNWLDLSRDIDNENENSAFYYAGMPIYRQILKKDTTLDPGYIYLYDPTTSPTFTLLIGSVGRSTAFLQIEDSTQVAVLKAKNATINGQTSIWLGSELYNYIVVYLINKTEFFILDT